MASPSATGQNTLEMIRTLKHDLATLLTSVRNVDSERIAAIYDLKSRTVPETFEQIIAELRRISLNDEANTLEIALEKVTDDISFGGLGLRDGLHPSSAQYEEILFLAEAWLKSIESKERAGDYLNCVSNTRAKRIPMTLAQKIFYQHTLGIAPPDGLRVGSVVRVGIDWILASELSWASMARTYEEIGSPGIWRNDRFWLAGDHVVHPSLTEVPNIKAFIETAEKAKRDFKMTEYQGMNYTIMHTEFVRERAEPGMLLLGSDSHTCSAGAVGCLGIGLGTADVMMALSLGATWFKIPESIRITIMGKPSFGITGKDVILHLLKELKRNTVATERIVEFDGDGLQHLSIDARFAISNMCTEFGAITGVFAPDGMTRDYVAKRRRKANRVNSLYFRPDDDAEYAGKYEIDLSQVQPTVARYPRPDDVVLVSEMAGTHLDGVFIGACTTTEEELVLGALVLEVGLAKKLPLAKGKRHYVPGSLPIVEKLRQLGLLEVYEAAGFTRGPPGCSMCVGLSAEKANGGEVWLSSQNRNFKNRMGAGSFGHLSTAIVCAASSFSMAIIDPQSFIEELDIGFWQRYKHSSGDSASEFVYVEPQPRSAQMLPTETSREPQITSSNTAKLQEHKEWVLKSKVATLGDFIDTDALAPGESLTSCVSDEEFGQYVLKHTHPDFREKVAGGHQIVVAGNAFGVGSSREVAVSALKGVGVKAVIARSFAFIYSRNQPGLGMLGITMSDESFFSAATDGADISIDVEARQITLGDKVFPFELSDLEYNLTVNSGLAESYKKYGKSIWEHLTQGQKDAPKLPVRSNGNEEDAMLAW